MTTIIDRPTLVLNRDWRPVGVATVARSLALVATDRARVVDPDTFTLHSWSEWAALRPAFDEPAIVAVSFLMRVTPIRPAWQPMYAPRVEWVTSWSKFVSDAYWNAELDA